MGGQKKRPVSDRDVRLMRSLVERALTQAAASLAEGDAQAVHDMAMIAHALLREADRLEREGR